MSATKTEFQRDKELVKWWVSVVKDDRFDKMMVFVRSAMSELFLTDVQWTGAKKVLNVLTDLVEPDPSPSQIPSPGLIHQLAPTKALEGKPESH